MATQIAIDKIADLLPIYSGDPTGLNAYIATVNAIWNLVTTRSANDQLWIALSIKAKLKGKAAEVNNEENLTSWPLIRTALTQKVRPTMNLRCAELELVAARQTEKESVTEFIERLKRMIDIVCLAFEPQPSEVQRQFIRSEVDRKALTALEAGLRNKTLRDLLLVSNLESFQETANFIREKEMKLQIQSSMQLSRANQCNSGNKPGHIDEEGQSPPQRRRNSVICHRCHQPGHFANQCSRFRNQDDGDGFDDECSGQGGNNRGGYQNNGEGGYQNDRDQNYQGNQQGIQNSYQGGNSNYESQANYNVNPVATSSEPVTTVNASDITAEEN